MAEPEAVLKMLKKACWLANFGTLGSPDWVRMIANCNDAHLAEAVEVALEDDSYTEAGDDGDVNE